MLIELIECEPGSEPSTWDSTDFKRIQRVKLQGAGEKYFDIVCVTFKSGGEVLFDITYEELLYKIK